MVVQVNYQTQLDAADNNSEFTQTQFFETDSLPEKGTVVTKLTDMGVDFAEGSVMIAAYIDADADTMRSNGFHVIKL